MTQWYYYGVSDIRSKLSIEYNRISLDHIRILSNSLYPDHGCESLIRGALCSAGTPWIIRDVKHRETVASK